MTLPNLSTSSALRNENQKSKSFFNVSLNLYLREGLRSCRCTENLHRLLRWCTENLHRAPSMHRKATPCSADAPKICTLLRLCPTISFFPSVHWGSSCYLFGAKHLNKLGAHSVGFFGLSVHQHAPTIPVSHSNSISS